MEITLKEVEVAKLNLQPTDILAVSFKSDAVDESLLSSLKNNFNKIFPNNKIMLFGIGNDDSIKFEILSQSAEQSYCSNCDCGKKPKGEDDVAL